jgi:predicted metal-dependent hydrolase
VSTSDAAVLRGVRLFNRGRYLSAQQVWEGAWRDADAPERPAPRGPRPARRRPPLRTRRGATRGAEHLVAQALATLEDFRPAAAGSTSRRCSTDYAAFLDWLREVKRPHRLTDRLRIPRLRTA